MVPWSRYQLIFAFLTKAALTESLITKVKSAESAMTRRVTVNGSGTRPGIPNTVTKVTAAMLMTVAAAKVLLGMEFQKWLLSLTLNTMRLAE